MPYQKAVLVFLRDCIPQIYGLTDKSFVLHEAALTVVQKHKKLVKEAQNKSLDLWLSIEKLFVLC